MKVEIYLKAQTNPVLFNDVDNAHGENGMYCVQIKNVVFKYPLCNILEIKEIM
jgi:hypothetical protein